MKPYSLHTDASIEGIGAVLHQEDNGVKQVIAYASWGLSKSERNYSIHKLEFLALKWAITKKFQDYLYGSEFTVNMDNNPLTCDLLSSVQQNLMPQHTVWLPNWQIIILLWMHCLQVLLWMHCHVSNGLRSMRKC